MPKPMIESSIPGLTLKVRGKVRDIYDLGEELLIVATDRISTSMSFSPRRSRQGRGPHADARFWFERRRASSESPERDAPRYGRQRSSVCGGAARPLDDRPKGEAARHRSDRARLSLRLRLARISGARDGLRDRAAEGLKDRGAATRNLHAVDEGGTGKHDENISFEYAATILGHNLALRVRDLAIRIYKQSAAYARERGIIIADTKFEFGILGDELILIDEVLTPDSSRFWPMEGYAPGRAQPSYDKQYVRDWLVAAGWDKKPPAPELPPDVVAKTSEKYGEALRRLTS